MSDCVVQKSLTTLRLVIIPVSPNTSQSPHFSFPLVSVLVQEVELVQTLGLQCGVGAAM